MKAPLVVSLMACLTCAVAPALGQAQAYPSKPVHMIVPFPPGGPTDIFGRVLGQKMGQELGQPVVIDNRAGAGGTIGAEAAAKAAADGYTIFFGTSGTHGSAPALYPRLGYDPVKSFSAISLLINAPILIVTNNQVRAGSLKELIDYAKANPGKLSYGSGNLAGNIVGEMFKINAGIDMVHVPYKGAAPAVTDLVADRVQMMFDLHTTFQPFLASSKARPLAVTAQKRLAKLPEIPTSAEAGLPGFEFSVWFALFAPRGLPADIQQRLNAEVQKALATREVKEAFAAQGMEPVGSTTDQLVALMAEDIPKWTRAVQASGAKVD